MLGFFAYFCEIRLTASNRKAILLIHNRNLKGKMVRKPLSNIV